MANILAKNIQPGYWILGLLHDMLVGTVEYTRDGQVLVRCDFGDGSETATNFYEMDEPISVRMF